MALAEGWGFVPGRGREKAIRLLDIAKDLGLHPETVRAVLGGYEVPVAILDAYDAELNRSDEAIEPVEKPKAKKARHKAPDAAD